VLANVLVKVTTLRGVTKPWTCRYTCILRFL